MRKGISDAYIRHSDVSVPAGSGHHIRCSIKESVSDWIISSSPSSGWLVETMFTESSLKMLPILTSDSHDDVPDE